MVEGPEAERLAAEHAKVEPEDQPEVRSAKSPWQKLAQQAKSSMIGTVSFGS
ncbi:hypothetical protein [Mitsuokella multacida]|uniref:hypothetical protein n=1 Tax=Mitsuokella multacida TaxID=52226 RepID=UPI0034A036C3